MYSNIRPADSEEQDKRPGGPHEGGPPPPNPPGGLPGGKHPPPGPMVDESCMDPCMKLCKDSGRTECLRGCHHKCKIAKKKPAQVGVNEKMDW